MAATLPPDVAALVDVLLAGLREALGDNLLGVYPRGSLALGDFDPQTSDIDVLVVTERPISEAEFAALAVVHDGIAGPGAPLEERLEVTYIDRAAIKSFRPQERHHPMLSTHEGFSWRDLRQNFMIERWIVREKGAALCGPDPEMLIDPVSREEIREAVASELRIRIDDWAGGDPVPHWLLERAHQAFEVQTVCRALCTLETGEMPTKPQAIDWALGALPGEWRPLVEWSVEHRMDGTEDGGNIPELRRFVHWAASCAEAAAGEAVP